ncbi:hypothetical protein RF11_10693 [Thelohanellus kitauei]|uniref:Uncharacterized protein n=1 Tax=Thelohanellus kitauei TaxID=669202 RepID=A0A0C2IWK5_THEKT|nr:hypothetical protein RF11_10693 [Thelohanellus kitauei]
MSDYPKIRKVVKDFDDVVANVIRSQVQDTFVLALFTITDAWEQKNCSNFTHKSLAKILTDDQIGSDDPPRFVTLLEELNVDNVVENYKKYRNFFNELKNFLEFLKTKMMSMLEKEEQSITKPERKHFEKIVTKLIKTSSCFNRKKEQLKECLCKAGTFSMYCN